MDNQNETPKASHYQYNKRWRHKHPDKAAAQVKRYRDAHREEYNAYQRDYKKRMRELKAQAAALVN